jgi:NADH-quinone oxidoreductase subunit G
VPFYGGLTLEEIGGKGVRWQDRDPAAQLASADLPEGELDQPPELPEGVRLGLAPSLWAGSIVEHSPSLRFLAPAQRAEIAPADARSLGVSSGDEVEVTAGENTLRATVALRQAMQPGTVFLVAGTADNQANALTNGVPRSVTIEKAGEGAAAVDPSTAAAVAAGPGARTPPT